ncbi:MAG: AraC family transcriptional regulator [Colwellia sp.]
MRNTTKKVVILELGNENAIQFTKLLQDNGYQVEIKENLVSATDTFTHALTSTPSNETIADKYNNVVELDLNMPTSIKSKDNVLIQKTCRYLKTKLCNKFVLDDIAATMGSNRSKLAATFKRVLGVGVFEWLRKQRMLKAKSLLIHSELSIQEIGFEVGHENSANFSSAYKKQFKISPRQQRNLAKVEIVTLSKVFNT